MKTIFVCKDCGSADVTQDATHHLNNPNDCYFHEDEWCIKCGGETTTIEVEVPNEFNVYKDKFDLSTLEEK
jgi:transcription elongation factor Elf1